MKFVPGASVEEISANATKAAENGMQACNACGDWLELDMWHYRCLGKGRHVRLPSVQPPAGRDYAEMAHAIVLVIVIGLALIVAALVFGGLVRGAP
jgi:hypothetical protein